MEFFTLESLKTVGGSALAVTLATSLFKLSGCVSGRATQGAALVFSLLVGAIIGDWSSIEAGVVTVLNSFVICAAAIGINQGVAMQKK